MELAVKKVKVNCEINVFKRHSKTRPLLERSHFITVRSFPKLINAAEPVLLASISCFEIKINVLFNFKNFQLFLLV